MLIEKLTAVISRVNPVTGEKVGPKMEKQYLVLLFHITDEKEEDKSFEIITGRKETFNFLYENIDSIDLLQSHVMSQTTNLEKAITAYSFMRFCLEETITEEEQEELEFTCETLNEHIINNYDKTEDDIEELYTEENK